MSHKALIWATQQRGLKPATKLLLIQLADHHNPVNGCFPGQELLSEECEMSVRSVRDHLGILESKGLIRRIKSGGSGSRRPSDRYVFPFEDSVGAIREAASPAENTGKTASPEGENTGSSEHEIPANQRNNYRQNLPPNLVREPVREPSVAAVAEHTGSGFSEFWEAHPRKRDQQRCEKLFMAATSGGVASARIIDAAKRYRAENAGNKPMYLAYADNWLENRRWEDFPESHRAASCSDVVSGAAEFWAAKLRSGSFIPPSAISSSVAHCMINNSLATEADLRRIGAL